MMIDQNTEPVQPTEPWLDVVTGHQYDSGMELAVCSVCDGAEGSLTTHCPGKRMSASLEALVYAGEVDFFDARWHRLGEVYWRSRLAGWHLVRGNQSLARMRPARMPFVGFGWKVDWLPEGSHPRAARVGKEMRGTIDEVKAHLEDRTLSELERLELRLRDDSFDPESVG